jgi:hypothetical protein
MIIALASARRDSRDLSCMGKEPIDLGLAPGETAEIQTLLFRQGDHQR